MTNGVHNIENLADSINHPVFILTSNHLIMLEQLPVENQVKNLSKVDEYTAVKRFD